MAVTLQITDGYATIDEADTYLENDSVWLAYTDETKQEALMWARYYLEDNFDYDLDSIDAIDEEAKLACAVVAADYAKDQKIFGSSEAAIKSKSIKADTVSSSITYETGQKYKPPSVGKAFVLMGKVADRKFTNTVSLIRG